LVSSLTKDSVGKFDKAPFVKNLVYSDKKKKNFFVIADHNTKVGKLFWKKAGTSGGKIRWAKPDLLNECLKCVPGEVNPFALKNDFDNKLPLIIIDENLQKEEFWSFHPMDNTISLEVKASDVKKMIEEEFKKKIQFLPLNDDAYPKEEPKKTKAKANNKKKGKGNVKGETKLKIFADKVSNFGEWYSEVIIKGDMIEYYDVSGCYILRPNSYYVWENIQRYMDIRFSSLGVQNVYFPMFLKKKHLESEKDHLEGFEAEVAWVTRSGKSELAEPIAIRPTSETIMYPIYKKWIQSHRDLPMLYNQWSNVVRWEFKNPTPFIRTREFLWQEGHTAHLTNEDCSDFVLKILDIYADCYKELLAVPVVKGRKSEIEKFAGADFTTTCETFIAEAGRSVQACTSHNLGQNFAKIFDITYEDKDMETKMPYQASWGFTTRSIGIMIMIHSDNKGLVLPPKVAFKQVVIIPITFTKNAEEVLKKSKEISDMLNKAGIRTHLDDRDNYKPGWKYNDWELKGIPLRLEVGPKDIQKNQYRTVRRVDGNVKSLPMENLVEGIKEVLNEGHEVMFKNAEKKLISNRGKAGDWEIFMDELNQMKYVETPWCCEPDCERDVKTKSAEESDESTQLSGKAKTLCLPFDQEAVPENTICFNCDNLAKKYAIWGRSY
jgi:prolyl-tRNA synthetase